MSDGKTYTDDEMRKIVDQQLLMNNITGFFQIALANGGNWGMTQGMLSAGQYCYRLIMSPAPAVPPKEKTPDAPQPEP